MGDRAGIMPMLGLEKIVKNNYLYRAPNIKGTVFNVSMNATPSLRISRPCFLTAPASNTQGLLIAKVPFSLRQVFKHQLASDISKGHDMHLHYFFQMR